jgi:hypothetical protein
MLIKSVLDRLDDAPEPLRLFYKKTADGKFALELDGDPTDNKKLREFRDSNRALNAKLSAFEGIDPAEVATMRATIAALDPEADSKRAAAEAEADALKVKLAAFEGVDPTEYRVLKAKPDDTKRAADLEAALASEKQAHEKTQFQHLIGFDFLRLGGRPDALGFIVGKAAETFTMADGKVTTKAFSAKDPGVPLTVPEWMTSQLAAADFAFQPHKGVGPLPVTTVPVKRTIDASDPFAFGRNLAEIARGDVTVS